MGIKGAQFTAGRYVLVPGCTPGSDTLLERLSRLLHTGLTGLISDEAPNAIGQHEIKTFFGRKVAIDASMSLYQFLIAVRQNDGQQLMSDSGETTR